MIRAGAVVAALSLLTACSKGEPPKKPSAPPIRPTAAAASPAAADPAPAAASAPLLNLAGEGLAFVDANTGSSRMLPFGVERGVIERGVSAALGAAVRQGRNPECGAGPLDFAAYPDGLTLWFQDGRFVGWATGEAARHLQTAAGVGVGSTRRELEGSYAPTLVGSTLGVEFQAGGISGLLASAAPDARITALWAGAGCVFR